MCLKSWSMDSDKELLEIAQIPTLGSRCSNANLRHLSKIVKKQNLTFSRSSYYYTAEPILNQNFE